jgi:hypothetical protein
MGGGEGVLASGGAGAKTRGPEGRRAGGRAWLSEPAVEDCEKRMLIEARMSVRERRVRENPPYLEAEAETAMS